MTLFFIVVTLLISIVAFSNEELFNKFKLNPYMVYHRKQWYRMLSHGFLHAGWLHLIINMLVFYSFGSNVEQVFTYLFGNFKGKIFFVLLYILGIVISSITSIIKHKENHYYNSVGASGAVSAVVFTSIFFDPWSKVYFWGIIGIPGIILGVIYLVYSYYMSKKGQDNINHDAHFIGALFGFSFPILLRPSLFIHFIEQLISF